MEHLSRRKFLTVLAGGADPHAAHAGGGLADGIEMPLLRINIKPSAE